MMYECKSWILPEPVVKTKIVLENRKHCYRYPRREKTLRKGEVSPKLQHCKTPYTTCDHKLEACTQEQLLKLEEQFRTHHDLIASEKKVQQKACHELWASAMRYSILTRGGVCYKPYPEIVSRHAEHFALCTFKENLKQIRNSNCRMAKSLIVIKRSMVVLDRRVGLLDLTVRSIFVRGTWNQPSLEYMREVVADMYQFYNGHLCKLNAWAQLLNPGDILAIEEYQTLVGTSTIGDDTFTILSVEGCSCKRPNNPNCYFLYRPCQIVAGKH